MAAASPAGMPGSVSGVTAFPLGPLGQLFEATGFQLEDFTAWSPAHALGFMLLVAGAFEFLNTSVPWLFATSRSIPQRGRHHDVLDATDTLYLAFNRLASVPFTYHYLRAAWVWPAIKW
jgi:hypothetical protein